jgi:uncharacterized protein (DUF58 family)
MLLWLWLPLLPLLSPLLALLLLLLLEALLTLLFLLVPLLILLLLFLLLLLLLLALLALLARRPAVLKQLVRTRQPRGLRLEQRRQLRLQPVLPPPLRRLPSPRRLSLGPGAQQLPSRPLPWLPMQRVLHLPLPALAQRPRKLQTELPP